MWRVFPCTLNINVLYLRFYWTTGAKQWRKMILLYDNIIIISGLTESACSSPTEHVPSNTVHQTLRESHQLALSGAVINSCVLPRFAKCLVFSRLFQQLITPYWLSCWASNDMEQGFSSEANIHSLSSSRNSPLYHAFNVRSFCTLLSVSATGPCSDPDAHSPHPHIPFISALSLRSGNIVTDEVYLRCDYC